jgi:hypothetical protein
MEKYKITLTSVFLEANPHKAEKLMSTLLQKLSIDVDMNTKMCDPPIGALETAQFGQWRIQKLSTGSVRPEA